jgi:hypothetical protein
MNSSGSKIAALEQLFNKFIKEGIVSFYDFGWIEYYKQTIVEIEWLKNYNHKVLELPTGRRIVIKNN